jgi:hypothetical protein
MGQIRRRDAAEIRERALATAVVKHAQGCLSCAESYLDLAREHGATEADIAHAARHAGMPAAPGAITPGAMSGGIPGLSGIGRRRLLCLAATAVVAGVAGNLLLTGKAHADPPPRRPILDPAAKESHNDDTGLPTAFFGVDSCTPPSRGAVSGMPLQFYIGELGATQHGAGCFNVDTATHVNPAFTHGYWGVCGPNAMPPDVTDPALFGQQQALAAINAWNLNPTVGGRTLFADIESGFGGWGSPAAPGDHVALVNAFLQQVAAAGFVPGIYINHSERDAWFPENYVAPVPFVYWVAGGRLAGTMCAPCQDGCDTLRPVVEAWTSVVQGDAFGGMSPVVWQYWLSGSGCGGDFNFSPQSGYSAFLPLPVASSTTPPFPGSGTPTPSTTPAATPIATPVGAAVH